MFFLVPHHWDVFAAVMFLHVSSYVVSSGVISHLDNPYKGMKICNRDENDGHNIIRRYVMDGRRWTSGKTLTWSFRDRFRLVKKEAQYKAVKEILKRALSAWSESSQGAISFQDVSPRDKTIRRRGQLDIQFAKFNHGDKEAFDGRGGIVAHSAYPPEGIIHFDASEHWSTDGRTGLDLRFVALHEIGHVLGLRHSLDPQAVMHPYYRDQMKDEFRLSEDDIEGIRNLYPLPYRNFNKMSVDQSTERDLFRS